MKNKIKITLVMESWGLGGTETYVAGLIPFLIANNIDPKLILLKDAHPVNIKGLSPSKVKVTGWGGLLRELTTDRPDLLSLHLYTNLLPATILGRVFSIPLVTTLHMPYSAWGARHRLYWRIAARLSHTVIGVSNKIINEIRGKNVFKTPIPGGVESLFFNSKKTKPSASRTFDIAAVGRLGKEKEWPILIQAVQMLPEKDRKRANIHFYGDGSELQQLKSLVHQGGVQAHFHGHISKMGLVTALSKAHLSVLPSRFEGMPLALLEGMAAGVPMIIADFLIGEDRIIQHGLNGHIFPKGNIKALADLIHWHMKNPKKAFTMGMKAQDFIKRRFSEKTVFLPYLDIFGREAKTNA